MKNIIFTIFLTLIVGGIQAQDIHFSQLDLNTALRNPAAMGQMAHNNKLTVSYRSQWNALPSNYRNITLGFEQRKSNFTWGTSILHNDAGRNSLRNTQLMLNFSYQKKLSERDEVLAIGISGGAIQKRFQPELFYFDNQYVAGEGLDNTLPNGETFIRNKQFLPTVTAGIFASKYLNRIKASVGVSFAHLNTPASEFFEGQKEHYPLRSSLFADAQLFMRKKLKGEVRFAWNKQSIADEKIIGLRLQYELSNDLWLTAGVANRLGDAFILEGGVKFDNGSVTVSYDMNNSNFTAVTQSNGALELSATYELSKRDAYKQPKIAEPFAATKEDMIMEVPKKERLDTDGDGVPDNEDECPTLAGLLQFNGCKDTDRDGVWDSNDACPNLYGEPANNGCPLSRRDSDQDGIIDEMDNCPFLRGTTEMGGCPDSDKDGISDMVDKCPFLKGRKDNNGCPKMNMEEHQEFVKKKSVTALVEYTTSGAMIEPQYYAQLEEVALFLLENPKAEAYIAGHTDNEGDSKFNYQLGESRAKGVMQYLLEVGVPSEQMSTISYGEFKPKQANKTAFEKAKNRRVEVTVYLR